MSQTRQACGTTEISTDSDFGVREAMYAFPPSSPGYRLASSATSSVLAGPTILATPLHVTHGPTGPAFTHSSTAGFSRMFLTFCDEAAVEITSSPSRTAYQTAVSCGEPLGETVPRIATNGRSSTAVIRSSTPCAVTVRASPSIPTPGGAPRILWGSTRAASC